MNEDLVGGGEGGMRQKLRLELVDPIIPGLSIENNHNKDIMDVDNVNVNENKEKKRKKKRRVGK